MFRNPSPWVPGVKTSDPASHVNVSLEPYSRLTQAPKISLMASFSAPDSPLYTKFDSYSVTPSVEKRFVDVSGDCGDDVELPAPSHATYGSAHVPPRQLLNTKE